MNPTPLSIPFNRAFVTGRELEYLSEAIAAGHISGDGGFTKKCSEFLERSVGTHKALITTSCTHALEMAALLLDFREGDEVILPSFTFVSTANAFALRGGRPVFVDIRPDTLNLDENKLAAAITPRTKAVVLVHYGGVACEMDAIHAILGQDGPAIVEDNAHGLFGHYRGRPLGSFGRLSTLSFHETKNVSCGEGGALLVNDPTLCDRAEILREKGTDRARFFRGQVDKYTWRDIGSSYLPSEMLAAFLFAQLEAHERIQAARGRLWRRYRDALGGFLPRRGCTLPTVPEDCDCAHHLFYVLCPSREHRDRLIRELKARGILAVFHYVPLHLSPMGKGYGYSPGDFPVTEDASDRLVRLPFFTGLCDEDQDRVCAAVEEITREW